MKLYLRIFYMAFVVTGVSACTFKSPNLAEQRYLMERGAFPNGAPAWMPAPPSSKSIGSGMGGFLGPQVLDTPLATSPALSDFDKERAARFKYQEERQKAAASTNAVKPSGPVERVVNLCPSLETELRRALLEQSLKARIKQYESFTQRCPKSADLWLSLAEDYERAKFYVKQGQALQQVLNLEPANETAQQALENNRRLLNVKPQPAKSKKQRSRL